MRCFGLWSTRNCAREFTWLHQAQERNFSCKHTLIVIFISFSIAFAQMLTLFQICMHSVPSFISINLSHVFSTVPLILQRRGIRLFLHGTPALSGLLVVCGCWKTNGYMCIWCGSWHNYYLESEKNQKCSGGDKDSEEGDWLFETGMYSNPNYGWKGKTIKFQASAAGNFGRSLDASAVHKIPTVFFLNERQQNVF